MDVADKIKNYKVTSDNKEDSAFIDLADSIINEFPYRLGSKAYLLVPEQRMELKEMAYEYYFTYGKTMPISLTYDMVKIIDKFNDIAEKLGFTVITQMSDYNNDGPLFNLIGTELSNAELLEENENLPKVNIPLTLSVDEFLKRPFLPVVFKNNTANRGEDKYLIETEEQLKKITALFELPESKKINLKEEFIVQEYIKGFDDINSSVRVYITSTGDVLFSLFLVSAEKEHKKRIKSFGIDVFNPCEYLVDSKSPYYLDSKNIISNAAGGARVIPLNPDTKLSANDEILLSIHDIDAETLELPETILNQCREVTKFWGAKKGIVLGIDFIYNSRDNNWYYLESNQNPSIEGYRRFMKLSGYQRKEVKLLMQLHALTKIVKNMNYEYINKQGMKK